MFEGSVGRDGDVVMKLAVFVVHREGKDQTGVAACRHFARLQRPYISLYLWIVDCRRVDFFLAASHSWLGGPKAEESGEAGKAWFLAPCISIQLNQRGCVIHHLGLPGLILCRYHAVHQCQVMST